MEILKGMVREKGFADKECTYMKTDDGRQFYFVENFQLSNGNIIACSDLSQGVGNKPRQTLGVITPRGDVIIPFENKLIKPLENDLLLVEKNIPTTQNVLDALSKKDDPLSASTLINEATTIKQQIKSVMSGSDEFLFDNQFSEAALYTLDGANVGGNYFSFIGKSGNDYFMSTNIVGSSILKYDSSITSKQEEQTNDNQRVENNYMDTSNENLQDDTGIENNNEINIPIDNNNQMEESTPTSNELPTETTSEDIGNFNSENEEQAINQDPLMPNIEIPLQLQQQLEQESNNNIDGEKIENENGEKVLDSNIEVHEEQPESENTLNINNGITNDEPEQGTLEPENAQGIDIPMADVNNNAIDSEEEINTNETEEAQALEAPEQDSNYNEQELNNEGINENNLVNNEEMQMPEDEETDDEQDSNLMPEDTTSIEQEDEVEETNDLENNMEIDEDSQDDITSDEIPMEDEQDDTKLNIDNYDTTEETPTEDEDERSNNLEQEMVENEDAEDDMEEEISKDFEEENDSTNPVILDATNTIRKLLEENRRQRELIDRQESEIETLTSSNDILKENNDSKSKEIISLRNSMIKYRNQNTKLTRENRNLKAINTRQNELIDRLKNQNLTLKEQVAGISALGNAVKEASTVITAHQKEEVDDSFDLSYLDEEADGV